MKLEFPQQRHDTKQQQRLRPLLFSQAETDELPMVHPQRLEGLEAPLGNLRQRPVL